MNIAVISFKDHDVTKGMDLLIEKYKENDITFLLPIIKKHEKFIQSVLKSAIDKKVKVTCYFESAVGLDHILKQADDISLTENPLKEVMRTLTSDDAIAMVWDDSPQAHFILHGTEDLALDTWDIYDGLSSISVEDPFDIDADEAQLHAEMMSSLGRFVDLMCAFVAHNVMNSLSAAVSEHIMMAEEDVDKRDINPFDDQE